LPQRGQRGCGDRNRKPAATEKMGLQCRPPHPRRSACDAGRPIDRSAFVTFVMTVLCALVANRLLVFVEYCY
jgi:hypothetical protein